MYRTILVGCDGSEHEVGAIALAQQLREPHEGRLILGNSFPLYRGFSGPGLAIDYADWLRDQAFEMLEHAEAHVAYGVPCERQAIASPSAAGGLNDLAETLNADLIVLGDSHHGLVGDLAGRKTIQRLLHGAPCAVAVAAPGQSARFGGSPRIYVAYDASPEARFALETAYGIAAEMTATVVLCFVLEPLVFASGFYAVAPDVATDKARERAAHVELEDAAALAPEGVTVEQQLLWGPPAHAVMEAASAADLVVAGSRGFGALHRALAGSTSGELLKNGRTPVLVTPRTVAQRASVLVSGFGEKRPASA